VAVGAQPEPEASGVFSPPISRYINRELSRLDFDERVLAVAEDPKLPLLERVRFLAIFSQNIDDFFQVRVAGLKEQVLAAVAVSSPDGMSPQEQLKAIRARVEGLSHRQVELYKRGRESRSSAPMRSARGTLRSCTPFFGSRSFPCSHRWPSTRAIRSLTSRTFP
jgi:hypothetical protein